MHNGETMHIRNVKVGQKVHWADPNNVGSGNATVVGIDDHENQRNCETIIHLRMANGKEVQAHAYELDLFQ